MSVLTIIIPIIAALCTFLMIRKDKNIYHFIFYLFSSLSACFVLAFLCRHMSITETIMYTAVQELLILCAVSDIDKRLIPDKFVVAVALLGLLSFNSWTYRLISFCIALLLIIIYSAFGKNGFGGGDLKLVAACTWILGGFEALTLSLFSLAAAAAFYWISKLLKLKNTKKSLALAPFIALGYFVTVILISV